MILAGFLLLAVGAVDLVRQFAARRWIGYLVVAVLLLVLGSVSDALLAMLAALVVGALWVWCMPDDRPSPAGFWPAVLLGLVSAGAVVTLPERSGAGLIGEVWHLDSPVGPISVDLAVLVVGAAAFLLESANLVVRAALDGEHTWRPVERRELDPTRADAEGADAVASTAEPTAAVDRRTAFQGGRLIGPLERILVLMLTLAAAYPLLAAMLAAKGIVRFPEISRGRETGARAEYFLVGSLVSWVIALGAAFLVWWSANS
ncbi:hypothetical protein ACIQTT_16600 [Microbacterium sp. NPDC090225]|uniref:hypothetical protein n=1 Tax=Microbacterium sp. NPDC090225 TaxID=3364207 RepID=UPI0037FE007A